MVKKALARKLISKMEDLSKLPVQTCPYVNWFKFKKCEIRTCKNYNTITPCQCLEIDRVKPVGTKVISDAELHLFKYGKSAVSTRLISMRRKKSVDHAKSILILRQFLLFIQEKYEHQGKLSKVVVGKNSLKSQSEYPLNIKILGFQNWMWAYVTDADVHNEFLEKQEGGDCFNVAVEDMLDLTKLKYNRILNEIKGKTI